MKTLPNGITIFNATPHVIRFWREGWDEPVEIPTDETISAQIEEQIAIHDYKGCTLVTTKISGSVEGHNIAINALDAGADFVIGSIIAAQAYPDLVVAMTPAPGYERVPPAEKRMNPDKFTVYR